MNLIHYPFISDCEAVLHWQKYVLILCIQGYHTEARAHYGLVLGLAENGQYLGRGGCGGREGTAMEPSRKTPGYQSVQV